MLLLTLDSSNPAALQQGNVFADGKRQTVEVCSTWFSVYCAVRQRQQPLFPENDHGENVGSAER